MHGKEHPLILPPSQAALLKPISFETRATLLLKNKVTPSISTTIDNIPTRYNIATPIVHVSNSPSTSPLQKSSSLADLTIDRKDSPELPSEIPTSTSKTPVSISSSVLIDPNLLNTEEMDGIEMEFDGNLGEAEAMETRD